VGGPELTVISRRPSLAARWREVLPLSSRSGFWRCLGLFLTMRLTRERSLRWMARRRRMETGVMVLASKRFMRRASYLGSVGVSYGATLSRPQLSLFVANGELFC